MCGIFACRQVDGAVQDVFEGLKRLEYRGYDSWGVAGLFGDEISIEKKAGKISAQANLNSFAKKKIPSQVAIGHTRWATHGGVTDTNAHPHLSRTGSFAVVQNGVVENYQELKRELEHQGYQFKTQTDTEVIVGLLDILLGQNNAKEPAKAKEPNKADAMAVFNRLTGRNTIVILTKSGTVFGFRNGSPLVLGTSKATSKSKFGTFLSSDTLSLSKIASEFYALRSGEAVEIFPDGNWQGFLAEGGRKAKYQLQPLTYSEEELAHPGFNSFMEKEIFEQAEVLSGIFLNGKEKLLEVANVIKKSRQVLLTAAGSASFVAGQTAWYLRHAGINAAAVPAYEIDSYLGQISQKDCVIAISQSGETADTNEAVEQLKAAGAKIISLVNMNGSTLSTQLADISCMLGVGSEIAVASTKAMTAQMTWGWLISQIINNIKYVELKQNIADSEQLLSDWLSKSNTPKKIRKLAKKLERHQHQFILGRGELFFPALEAALKLKEISYRHAEGFSGGELKHGVLALIEKDTPIYCLVQNDVHRSAQLNAAAEVKARGGMIIGISPENNQLFDEWIEVPDLPACPAIAHILPFQLLTCYLAEQDGLNPDKPRNLAKSVTVK